jgi:hypothetical protein
MLNYWTKWLWIFSTGLGTGFVIDTENWKYLGVSLIGVLFTLDLIINGGSDATS